MYHQDIQKYSIIFQRFSNVGIGFGVLAGCLGALSLGLGVADSQALIAISSILAFGTSLCEGYIRKCDFEGKIGDLKRQATKYSGIVNNIRRQLGLPRDKRERADDYQRWITQNYQELSEVSIVISPEVIMQYRLKTLLEKLPYPDDVCAESNIVIYTGEKTREKETDGKEEVLVDIVEEKVHIRNPSILQDALPYSDKHMRYELARLENQ